MSNNNNKKQEGAKQQTPNAPDDSSIEQMSKNTDTAPDQFIGPNADTDTPFDGEVVNDAVLRGENKPEEKAVDGQTQDSKEVNKSGPAKMDADKK